MSAPTSSGSYRRTPRLTLGHATLAARDLDRLATFYCDVLGFEITNRGPAGPSSQLVFLSQDPGSHHQIAMVEGVDVADSAFLLVDHFAFRTETLDDIRSIHANLIANGVEGILQICHGNSWSLYFSDCEGNGLECYVDTPFHVAQPFASGFDLDQADEAILKTTIELIESQPEFQPMAEWQANFARRLEKRV